MLNLSNNLPKYPDDGQLIVIALMAVPFSMSHAASVVNADPTTQEAHSEMVHMAENPIHTNDMESLDHNNHQNHGDSDCCSSICGGALTVEFYNTPFVLKRTKKQISGVLALAPGEWVTPHRPPSI